MVPCSQAQQPASPVLALPKTTSFEASDGHYFHIKFKSACFPALCAGALPTKGAVAATIWFDPLLEDRLETVRRFASALDGKTLPPDPRLTSYRLRILRQTLQVLDGRMEGATYQAIAQAVCNTKPVGATAWKTMPERDAVMRRCREGMKLVEGGYRRLLSRRRLGPGP